LGLSRPGQIEATNPTRATLDAPQIYTLLIPFGKAEQASTALLYTSLPGCSILIKALAALAVPHLTDCLIALESTR
jgi:hypothetical protein